MSVHCDSSSASNTSSLGDKIFKNYIHEEEDLVEEFCSSPKQRDNENNATFSDENSDVPLRDKKKSKKIYNS